MIAELNDPGEAGAICSTPRSTPSSRSDAMTRPTTRPRFVSITATSDPTADARDDDARAPSACRRSTR